MDLIADLLAREGGFRAAVRRPDGSWDPNTNFGLTAPVWGRYKGLGRPATVAELKAMTRDDAATYYRYQLAQSPFRHVAYEPLFAQLWDFGENSSEARATRWLQRILRVPVTSVMDERTITALGVLPQYLVHEALIAQRVRMIRGAVKDGTIRAADEDGLVARAISFTQIQVEDAPTEKAAQA